jgi:hypothetical protein
MLVIRHFANRDLSLFSWTAGGLNTGCQALII